MAKEASDQGLPRFIYGTAWKEDQTRKLTSLALACGFRGIDTANQPKHYRESAVGNAVDEAIEEGVIDRSDLFLQTKYTYPSSQNHRLPYDPDAPFTDQVQQSLKSSLDHLGTSYVDSYILHGPSTRSGIARADREVWRTLEQLAESDRVEWIGVSNVSPDQLKRLLDIAERPPAFVQNRCFARTGWDRETRGICSRNGITYQGFSLITANQRELQSEIIQDIADKRDKTIPQIVFRFALELDMIPLTGTTSKQHMKQDLTCFEFELSNDEVKAIATISE